MQSSLPVSQSPFPALVFVLLLAGCSWLPSSRKEETGIQPAADAATAKATTFSTSLVEVFLGKRGTIARGTITTDAPLATATTGTYSLETYPEGALSYPGYRVISALRQQDTGQVRLHRSGNQTIVELLLADGRPLLKIIGPPHRNSIESTWFYQGSDSGIATLRP